MDQLDRRLASNQKSPQSRSIDGSISGRSVSQESPYSKPYHSYRIGDRNRHRDNDPNFVVMSSTKSSLRLSTDDKTKSETNRPATETRRMSATGGPPNSPAKRTAERRLSSGGDTAKKCDNSADDLNADEDDTNESNSKSGKSNGRRGVATTEQHDKQKSLLNTVRTNLRTRSESTTDTPVGQTRVQPKSPIVVRDKARKGFAKPFPPNTDIVIGDKTSTTTPSEPNLSQDDSSTHSTSPSKKKRRRRYKGGTYGLYLSKKPRKLQKTNKDIETKKVNQSLTSNANKSDCEESLQSFTDGELDGQSSDISNAIDGEDIVHKLDGNEDIQQVMTDAPEDTVQQSIDNEMSNKDIIVDNVIENKDQLENNDKESPNKTLPPNESNFSSPAKRKPGRGRRPAVRPVEDDQSVTPLSTPSKSSPLKDELKLINNNNNTESSVHEVVNKSLTNGTSGQVFQMPANNVNSSVVQNPNRRTLLRISTAGSVQSGDTTGTQMGAQMSVVRKEKPTGQASNCMCSAKPLIDSSQKDISKGKPLYCQAIDCFDEKLIGCCNQVRLTSLFRSSKLVPYRILCEVHLARLRRHHCCPGCGLFCTQGEFNECFSIKKQLHLFHNKCQTVRPQDPKAQNCLHCGNTSTARMVRLEMNGPLTNNTYYLQQTSILKTPKVRISMTKRKGRQKVHTIPEEFEEPGIEYTIPTTHKILSLAGLAFGPSRKQLEELLHNLSADKQSIRLTIQHNKNFYAVAKNGEVDKVLSILAQGFDPNFIFEDNDNETPLHAAANCGHILVVHLLIQSGANANVLNKNQTTPLMQAIEHKHNVVVKYLINCGASLDIRGQDGMTSLHIAAKCGNIEAVHYIINSAKINVNLQDDGGWSALVWATEHKYHNIVKLLVSKGADPNIEDDEENVGLHWAAFSGETNIAFMFLEMGANVLNQTNIHGDTPLHIAARRDNYECVLLLLSRGADITLMNKNNETPLMCAPNDSESEMALKVNQELKRFSLKRQLNSEKLLHRDLSKGKEYYQIQVVNGYDNEPYPIDFMYVTDNCEASQINIDRTITSLQSCQCEDDCTSQKCVCAAISFRCWYDKEGKLLPEFNLMDAPMIFECNRACSCWKTCNNRVVQYGVRSRLQVFRTQGKGWGVRALRDIPKGTFVCEYVGEIISDSEADRREDDSYLFDLDNKDGETYCLDARFYGNICRFINHLCNPNLTPVKVFVDHQDLSFPRIALFSSRDIKAYEELGFDYGEKFWVIKYKSFTCRCGWDDCKYNKDTIHTTIENYYKRLRDEQLSIASPTNPIYND